MDEFGGRGTMVNILLPDPAALGLIPSIPPKNSEETIVNVTEVNQRGCLVERGAVT